jgi:CHAT domain-containing protein/tetratricopeptide (TPR) repeat protein
LFNRLFTRVCLLPAIALGCALASVAQQTAGGDPAASSGDEAALRSLVLRYYDSYARKDLEGIAAVWSRESSIFASRRELLRRNFASENYAFTEPSISKIRIEGTIATARVVVERTATGIRADSNAVRKTTVRADLTFVNDQRAWSLWDEAPAVNGLVNRLASARTDADRQLLLAEEADLVDRQLLFLLTSQSDRAYTTNSHARALQLLLAARPVAELIGDRKELINIWLNTGIIYFVQKRFQQALDAYQQGLAIAGETGRRSEAARLSTSLGLVHSAIGNHRLALEFFQRGLVIHEELDERGDTAAAHENIGDLHHEQGDYPKAVESYQKSIKWFEAAGARSAVAHRLLKIAKTEYEQGNDERAIDLYTEAENRFVAANDRRSIGYVLHNIANIHYSAGDYARAMSYYARSLQAEDSAGTRPGVAAALQGIGLIHSLNGHYDLALDAYRRNLGIAQSLNNKADVASAWQKAGGAHFGLNQMDQALEAYKQALSLREELTDAQETANALIDLGVTYAAQSEYERALEAYHRSKALYESAGNHAGVAAALLNESLIAFAQKGYAKALELADEAARLAKLADDSDLFWQARYRAGKAHYRSGRLDLARQAFVESIAAVETLRPMQNRGQQPRFYESKLAPYLAMVDVAISEGKGNEAFDFGERAKSRVLLGVLQSGKVWIKKSMSAREREQERKFLKEIATLTAQFHRQQERVKPNAARIAELRAALQKTRDDYAAFRNRLFAQRPQLKVLRGEGKTLNSAQAASLLVDSKTALLEFVETDESVYLFAFGKPLKTAEPAKRARPVSPLRIYILATDRADLYARLLKFQQAIAERDDGIRQHSRELYDLLLRPAQSHLAAYKHLVIAPDAVSWNLPFQALMAEDGRYLIESHAVSYVSSLTALRAISTLRFNPRDRANPGTASPVLAVFSNPEPNPAANDRIDALLSSRQNTQFLEPESYAAALGKLYGERQAVVYTGAGAREDRIKSDAGKFKLLHLSIRTVLNETAPLFSFSATSPNANAQSAPTEDGLLEVREILDLNLSADLVVLPASELAMPRAGAIRSMTGLGWTWFIAGCPASLAGQWRADAQAAAELMVEFHRGIKEALPRPAIAESWQSAVRKLLDRPEYRHPYFWSGFTLLGDTR